MTQPRVPTSLAWRVPVRRRHFKIDGAQLRVEALRDLDVPQIKALERLHRLAVEHAGREDDKSIATAHHEDGTGSLAGRALPGPRRTNQNRRRVCPNGHLRRILRRGHQRIRQRPLAELPMSTRSIGKGHGSHRPMPVLASSQARSAHHSRVAENSEFGTRPSQAWSRSWSRLPSFFDVSTVTWYRLHCALAGQTAADRRQTACYVGSCSVSVLVSVATVRRRSPRLPP
jgi:hypothetical protein